MAPAMASHATFLAGHVACALIQYVVGQGRGVGQGMGVVVGLGAGKKEVCMDSVHAPCTGRGAL